jgi:pimeloyl-ACP methyl ester carboxylesterase
VSELWLDVAGARMHAQVLGAGPPVVLLHGYGVSGTYMLPVARELADSYRVLVPELPGQGKSEPRPGLRSVHELAGAFGAWLEAAELEQPGVVANSLGCQVVTELAVRRPQQVGPLVLIGPTIDPERRQARRQVLAAVRDLTREPLSLLAVTAHDDAVMGPRALLATVRAAFADRIEERLPLIEQPVLVVRGERDPFVTADWAERAVSLLRDGRLAVVPGAPHAVHYSRPDVVAGLVDELLVEEVEDTRGELVGRLPHRDMSARQDDESRAGEEAPPLPGDARGRQPVVLAPDDQRLGVNPGELGPQVSV